MLIVPGLCVCVDHEVVLVGSNYALCFLRASDSLTTLNACLQRMGGAITAALFLKEYVNEMKWAHLDIAGPVWDDKQGGATGFGACSLAAWVVANSKKN